MQKKPARDLDARGVRRSVPDLFGEPAANGAERVGDPRLYRAEAVDA